MTLSKGTSTIHSSSIPLLLIIILLTAQRHHIAYAATIRYRQGTFPPVENSGSTNYDQAALLYSSNDMTVTQARQWCQLNEACVSFGFASAATRFPGHALHVRFYPFADWHVSGNDSMMFVEDPTWHFYVNTTREVDSIPREMKQMLARLEQLRIGPCAFGDSASKTTQTQPQKAKSSLRRASSNSGVDEDRIEEERRHYIACVEPLVLLLDAVFHIVFPKELKSKATPYLIRPMLELALQTQNNSNNDQQYHEDIRTSAINNVIVMADSADTAPMLVRQGVYEVMTAVLQQELQRNNDGANDNNVANGWDGLPILSLDVISNIAMYRTANDLLEERGARPLLEKIVRTESGFPRLQALLALLHLGDESIRKQDSSDSEEHTALAQTTLNELVELLQNSIDGDVVYGIKWDLIPGPLSAIQLLLEQHHQLSQEKNRPFEIPATTTAMVHHLLDAGLIEQLLRILEAPCLVATHMTAALEILNHLSTLSKRAQEMILLMAANAIQMTRQRLNAYQQPAQLANKLTAVVTRHDFGWHNDANDEL